MAPLMARVLSATGGRSARSPIMRQHLILTHNHPSGVAEPSQADKVLTERLKKR